MKNAFDRLIENLMQLRKESVNIKRGQQKLYKLKHKEKKKTTKFKSCGTILSVLTKV